MLYIIDTYAWIEYFKGSMPGLVLRRLFKNQGNKLITMECCIAEIRGYCLKNNFGFDELYKIVSGDPHFKGLKNVVYIG